MNQTIERIENKEFSELKLTLVNPAYWNDLVFFSIILIMFRISIEMKLNSIEISIRIKMFMKAKDFIMEMFRPEFYF